MTPPEISGRVVACPKRQASSDSSVPHMDIVPAWVNLPGRHGAAAKMGPANRIELRLQNSRQITGK
jgi:hypothetical protein